LRVSVGTLVRLLFPHPATGEILLALERKATQQSLSVGERTVFVRAQPFGGAVRLRDAQALKAILGEVHFDSPLSQAERDFRILIRPGDWPALRQFCLQHLGQAGDPMLDADPARELAEEFADALALDLSPARYSQRAAGLIVEDRPTPTDNPRAPGTNTVRVYRVFEVRLHDADMSQAILDNSQRVSNEDLEALALSGTGRANGALALPLRGLTAAYLALPPGSRALPLTFGGHLLDRSVAAVLEGVAAAGYQRL
jgi:hypothetical protein